MSKPIFLFCPAFAKSGTTLLSDILFTNQLFHYGYVKECSYLDYVYWGEDHLPRHYIASKDYIKTFPKRSKFCYHNFDEMISKYTLDKYCQYYLDVYRQSKFIGGVLDFSQSYHLLPDKFILEVKDVLSEYFEIKIVLLVRDPIKRLFSFSNMLEKNHPKDFFLENLMINTIEFQSNFYQRVIEKFESIFSSDNVFIASMEELYDQQSNQFENLKQFLKLPKGIEIDADYSKYDQFAGKYSDKLSDRDIEFAKTKLIGNYSFYKNRFGQVPNGWYNYL
jgi:hypothetical protein